METKFTDMEVPRQCPLNILMKFVVRQGESWKAKCWELNCSEHAGELG
jgi:hypothetical protein